MTRTRKCIKYLRTCLKKKKIKLQLKKLYIQNKLKKNENNVTNTWKIMKIVIGKSKVYNDNFPKRLNIDHCRKIQQLSYERGRI